MKYPHILENEGVIDNKKLVFTAYIDEKTGKKVEDPLYQPVHWDNVRNIAGNIFYAWQDGFPENGSVYVGEYK